MSHISDCMPEDLRAYYQANGATSNHISDAQYEFLIAQGATAGQVNDMWYEVLAAAGYEGALDDMLYQFWCENAGDLSPVENLAPNSVLDGMSGSVGGGDWVFPTGWDGGFWPPDDAIALPDGKIHFITEPGRGYINIQFPVIENEFYNLSCYVDAVTVPNGQRACQLQGPGSLMTEIDGSNLAASQTGRRWGVWQATRTDDCNIRLGAGTTAEQAQNFIASRPQVTRGINLRPYRPTTPGPIQLIDMQAMADCMANQGWTITGLTQEQFTIQETGAIVTRAQLQACDFSPFIGPVGNDLEACLNAQGFCQ